MHGTVEGTIEQRKVKRLSKESPHGREKVHHTMTRTAWKGLVTCDSHAFCQVSG